jgi:hypothetical protein
MDFEIVSEITDVETIAVGVGVRDRARLRRQHGLVRWRKLKVLRQCGSLMVEYGWREFIGMKLTASAKKNSNSSCRF